MSNIFDPGGFHDPAPIVMQVRQETRFADLRPKLDTAIERIKQAKEFSAAANRPELVNVSDVILSHLTAMSEQLEKWDLNYIPPSTASSFGPIYDPTKQPVIVSTADNPWKDIYSPSEYFGKLPDTIKPVTNPDSSPTVDLPTLPTVDLPTLPTVVLPTLADILKPVTNPDSSPTVDLPTKQKVFKLPDTLEPETNPYDSLPRMRASIEMAFGDADKKKDVSEEYTYQRPAFQCYGDFLKAWEKAQSIVANAAIIIVLGICFANSVLNINVNLK